MSTYKIISYFCLALAAIPSAMSQNVTDVKILIENERYNSAEAILEKSIENSDPEPEVNYLLVKTYLDQDKTSEAKQYVNRYLQSASGDNDNPLNRIAYARYLINAGNMSAAEAIFDQVLADKKNQKDAHLLLAMAEVVIDENDGDARVALSWLDKAGKKDKKNPDIDIARGLAYRKLNDATNAYLAYQNAIKKDPLNVKAHYLLGKIFAAQKNPDVYMEHFMKAYQIDSTYAPVLEELYNHFYNRDVREAKKYLEKFIDNTDYSLRNSYSMTDMLYLNGKYQEAIKSATDILRNKQSKVQPRLYKLIAYSYAMSGDSSKAFDFIKEYFENADPAKLIAADFLFYAQLLERKPGQEEAAITYYSAAFDLDSIKANKADYAAAIAGLYNKTGNYSKQATWLGKLYTEKGKTNNVDLFNWGIAWYKAKDFRKMDSVFSIYTTRYPENIYGYYWRAQANAAIDTAMADHLAIPYYTKVVEIGEKDIAGNKKMLLKAYGYLGGYEANITKNYKASLEWFEKYNAIEVDPEVSKYIEMLQQWISGQKE